MRFERLSTNRILVTNFVGEHVVLEPREFELLTKLELDGHDPLTRRLRALHLIQEEGDTLPAELLALKTRTRLYRLSEFTGLHMFVVTLRCEHSCQYCQVSRQNTSTTAFDMSPESASQALDLVFRSPSQTLKIEFQGGEPLLNWPMVEYIVVEAVKRNIDDRDLQFVVATNLALLDERVLDFSDQYGISFSTSLDGPRELHNRNRPRPGSDSWERTIQGIDLIRSRLGRDRVSALMTTSIHSLANVRQIVDTYVEHGLTDIFLRPLSPYGFAARRGSTYAIDSEQWMQFYVDGLDYIIELALSGVEITERYAAIILHKILTNGDPGYVDLASPSGIGIRALLYNYDGAVYASDEGRMLAEMGDQTFRLGHVGTNTYQEILLSEALLAPLEDSFTGSVPMCDECAYESWCGSDPVFHHTTSGDFVGRKPESVFCRRNMTIFQALLDRYHRDPATRDLFRRWANR